jgi:hypothetical protein
MLVHSTLNTLKTEYALTHICNQQNIQLVQLDIDKCWEESPDRDLGRDLGHYGKKVHELMAKKVLMSINEDEDYDKKL